MTHRRTIAFALALAALALLFVLFKPAREPAPATGPAVAAPMVVDLVIARGKLVSGPSVIHARQGDILTLHVRCDVAEEFHLHGYDRMLVLEPAKAAMLNLVADHSGRFEFELERSRVELGVLEVQPR